MRFFFSSRRRHTRYWRDWSSDVCSSDLPVKCGRVEHPIRFRRTHGRCDSFFIRHVQLLVGKSHGLLTEQTHEVLPELARRADDRNFQTAPSLAISSFSQRMLK